MTGVSRFSLVVILLALAFGCERNDMADQPRNEAYEPSNFFADGQSARPLVDGTVPRSMGETMSLPARPASGDQARDINAASLLPTTMPTGAANGGYPFPITLEDLERGRERYDIYCSVCHGATGDGNGMIVQRGFTPPPSFILRTDRKPTDRERWLQTAPPAHFYDAMTNGWGAMFSYSDRVDPADRWRITAYVRVLQFAQHADENALPAEDRAKLRQAQATPTGHGAASPGSQSQPHQTPTRNDSDAPSGDADNRPDAGEGVAH